MELQISETREELLSNTINYFNSNNRGLRGNGYSCTFINHKTSNRCAIGRELPKDLAIYVDEHFNGFQGIYNKLPIRLKKMGDDFIRSIQNLHDVSVYWDEYGLSGRGYDYAKRIISDFNLDLQI